MGEYTIWSFSGIIDYSNACIAIGFIGNGF